MAIYKFSRPTDPAEKATQTTLDTIEITPKLVAAWKSPPFQRPIRENQKVLRLVDEVRRDGVLPGILTLGVLDDQVHVVDGQHRLHAFLKADVAVAYADVRTHYLTSMAAMAAEFVRLNSQLVRLRPDDILKGLEQSNVWLQRIRKRCPFVGYDGIRRGATSPVLSMSQMLRVWAGTKSEVPAPFHSALPIAEQLDEVDTARLTDFLLACFEAWHRDVEYAKLWGSLNLLLCGWLWQTVVLGPAGTGQSRSNRLTIDQFKRGMMSLSASTDYLEWLVGRNASERDRAPAYQRLKTILASRYLADHKSKLKLPSPPWARQGGS